MMASRENSVGICGGAFGDEGKGRIVDECVNGYLQKGMEVIVYRDNGGANAGHTIELGDGRRVAMHLLPSGVLCPEATVILGKGMVIHPGDFNTELKEVKAVTGEDGFAKIMVDEMALLNSDPHRAYEAILKTWQDGGKGATGRGIAFAYTDETQRFALRMRDLTARGEDKIRGHYRLYQALLSGLGADLSKVKVPAYGSEPVEVGSEEEFLERLLKQSALMEPYITNVNSFLKSSWSDKSKGFVFEKAQAIGLDRRWGVYPDITASDCTFDGIFSATEGIVDPDQISSRIAVIKATYMSTVGSRTLPTVMEDGLAKRIREDAKEYGATTKRPRGIAYIDLPALRFFGKVGRVSGHVLTHMDIVYPDIPIKVCSRYTFDDGKETDYRPDQEHLLKVRPVYIELPTWGRTEIQKARTYDEIPKSARDFLEFMEDGLSSRITMITTGPRRDQSIMKG